MDTEKDPNAVALGRKGGQASKGKTSRAKAATARRNGRKGGWATHKKNLEKLTKKVIATLSDQSAALTDGMKDLERSSREAGNTTVAFAKDLAHAVAARVRALSRERRREYWALRKKSGMYSIDALAKMEDRHSWFRGKTMKLSVIVCLMCLLSVPALAQTKAENIFTIGATAFDMATTVRFIKSGRCVELNPQMPREPSQWGPQDHRTTIDALTMRRSDPSTAKIVAHGAYRALSIYAVQRALREVSKRSNNRVTKTLAKHLSIGYGIRSNAESTYLGIRNIRTCGW